MEEFAHPFTLRFLDSATERAYQDYRLRAFFRDLDTRYLAAQTLLAAGFFLLAPFVFPSITFHWANVLYPALCLVDWLVIQALPWAVYARHRHRIQLLFRAAIECNVVWGLPSWSPPVPVRCLGSFATHLLLTSGAGCLNWASLGWPLLLQHHMPYNLAATAAFSHALAPHMCEVVCRTARGRDLMAALWAPLRRAGAASQKLRRLLLLPLPPHTLLPALFNLPRHDPSSESSLRNAASPSPFTAPLSEHSAAAAAAGTATAAGLGLGPAAAAGSFPGDGGSFLESLPEDAACWASVSLTQLLLGFLVPTALIYIMERGSREHFLRLHRHRRGARPPEQPQQQREESGSPEQPRPQLPPQQAGSGAAGRDNSDSGGAAGEGSGGAGMAGAAVDAEDGGGVVDGGGAAAAEVLLSRGGGGGGGEEALRLRLGLSDPDPRPEQHPQHHCQRHRQPDSIGDGGGIGGAGSQELGRAAISPAVQPPLAGPRSPWTRQRLQHDQQRGAEEVGEGYLGLGGWGVCALLQQGVWLLLAALLVLLLWELQIYVRFLSPVVLRGRRHGGGGGEGFEGQLGGGVGGVCSGIENAVGVY